MTTKTDRVILDAKKAYAGTHKAVHAKLIADRSYWMRKQTIAKNKLADVQRKLDVLLEGMVDAAAERGDKHHEEKGSE